MTNLVELYLTDIKTHLGDDQEDILLELRSNIEASIEAKEDELEQPLKDEQIAEILKKVGHPIKVASQFKKQQYLIGPELYLAFTQVLKYALLAVVAIQALLLIAGYYLGNSEGLSFGVLIYRILHTGINVAMIVTGVFIVLEYYGQKITWYNNWEPLVFLQSKKLPANRQVSISNIISDAVLFLWWNNWFQIDTTLPFLGGLPIVATDVYAEVFIPVNAILVSSLIFSSWQLLNNAWNKVTLRVAIAIDLTTLVLLGYMLSAKGYFMAVNNAQEYDLILDHINLVAMLILVVIAGFIVYDLYRHTKNWQKLNSL